MALELEFERLRNQRSRFKDLCDRAERAEASRPYLSELLYCNQRIAAAYERGLEDRLAFIEATKKGFLQAAASQSHKIEKAAAFILNTLGSAIQRLAETPEELVEFTKWCFERVTIQNSPFAFAVDDSVRMLTLRQMAESLGLKETFPELFKAFEEPRVAEFVVLLIPEHFLNRSSSLSWCVVAHEVAHAFLERSQLISQQYPTVPPEWHVRRERVRIGDHETQEAIQVAEYACDEVAVRLTGCAFAWRLFRDFFSLEGMSSSKTHPPINRRVERAADLASKIGFSHQADLVRQQLTDESHAVDFGIVPIQISDEKLSLISAEIAKAIPTVTADEMVAMAQRHEPPMDIASVCSAIRSGRPVALDAWTVYCAVTPDKEIHASPKLQAVVAESIRLGQISTKFKEIMLSQPPSS